MRGSKSANKQEIESKNIIFTIIFTLQQEMVRNNRET